MEEKETQPTPEFDGHVEETSATEPQTETTTEPSLEEIAKAYNMTPAQVIKSYGEAQKKITKTSQELSDYRKRMQWAEQFGHEINTKKGLREHIEGFYEDKSDIPPEVKGAIDPITQRLNQLEIRNYDLEMNAKIKEIGEQFPIDQTIRDSIFKAVSDTGNPDVEAHYWKLMGPKLAGDVTDATKREILSAKNRDAYVPNRGVTTKGKTVDIRGLSQAEWSNSLQDEIEGMFRKTE